MTAGRGRPDTGGGLELDAFVARRCAAGWRPTAIVAATDGQISLRTAYRWVKEVRAVEDIRVGDHVATFAIRRTMTPLRVSEWRRS